MIISPNEIALFYAKKKEWIFKKEFNEIVTKATELLKETGNEHDEFLNYDLLVSEFISILNSIDIEFGYMR